MQSVRSEFFLGATAAFFSSVTWATGVTTYSALSERYSPSRINFMRIIVALPLFLLVVLWNVHGSLPNFLGSFLSVDRVQYLWLGISVVSSYAFGDMLFMWSSLPLGVPGALAIASTYPLWSALAGWLFRGESLGPVRLAGLVLVVLGTVIVILSGARDQAHTPNVSKEGKTWRRRYNLGVCLALLCSLFWCLNTFAIAKVGTALSAPVSSAIRMLWGVLLAPLFGFAFAREKRLLLGWRDFRPIIWVFIFEGFGGSLLFLYGLIHSPLAIGSALSSLAPVLAVPFAFIHHRERIPKLRLLGIILVVIGIWALVV